MGIFHDVVNEISGISKLDEAKQTKKDAFLIIFIGTILVNLLCFGIMYLRFRVFGG